MNLIHPIAAHHAAVSVMLTLRYIADNVIVYKAEAEGVVNSIEKLTETLRINAEASEPTEAQMQHATISVVAMETALLGMMDAAISEGINAPEDGTPEWDGLNEYWVVAKSVFND